MSTNRLRSLHFRKMKARSMIGKKIRYTVSKGNSKHKKGEVLEGLVIYVSTDIRKNIVYYRFWSKGTQSHVKIDEESIEVVEYSIEERLFKIKRNEVNKIASKIGITHCWEYTKIELIYEIIDRI